MELLQNSRWLYRNGTIWICYSVLGITPRYHWNCVSIMGSIKICSENTYYHCNNPVRSDRIGCCHRSVFQYWTLVLLSKRSLTLHT